MCSNGAAKVTIKDSFTRSQSHKAKQSNDHKVIYYTQQMNRQKQQHNFLPKSLSTTTGLFVPVWNTFWCCLVGVNTVIVDAAFCSLDVSTEEVATSAVDVAGTSCSEVPGLCACCPDVTTGADEDTITLVVQVGGVIGLEVLGGCAGGSDSVLACEISFSKFSGLVSTSTWKSSLSMFSYKSATKYTVISSSMMHYLYLNQFSFPSCLGEVVQFFACIKIILKSY